MRLMKGNRRRAVREPVAGAVAILHVGGVDDDAQQQAERVDEDVALAPGDLLARVPRVQPSAGPRTGSSLRVEPRPPFMEWPAPLLHHDRVATGGWHEGRSDSRSGPGQEQLQLGRFGRGGTGPAASSDAAGVVAMEACCGAHHFGRLLVAQGHEVRLMSPEYVRPYVKAQKNDDRDAEAIAEGRDPADDAVRGVQDGGAA